MKESIHYLLMADHFLVQKALLASIKDSGLTPGQPKILDYLQNHNGCVQKDIAKGCHIEPASITVILKGMETKGYIGGAGGIFRYGIFQRPVQKGDGDFPVGVSGPEPVKKFKKIENAALKNFNEDEKQKFNDLLMRVYENMLEYDKEEKQQ